MSDLLLAFFGSLGIYILFVLFFLTGLRRLKPIHQKPDIWPKVSIIIAARNEEKNIAILLDDLSQLDYPVGRLEVVIADDRSTDNTWSIISGFSNRFSYIRGIQIIEPSSEMTPKKFALTQAINQSNGQYILSTDADCRLPKGWVKSMVCHLEDGNGIVVGASSIDPSFDTRFAHYQMIDFLALVTANAGAIGWGRCWTGTGQNLGYSRSAFGKINGFNPVKDRISGDDMYLVQSISRKYPCTFNTDAESFVKTQPVRTFFQFINQRIRWSSNSRFTAKTNWFFLLFLLNAFLLNTFIFAGIFIDEFQAYLPMVFGIKFLCDALVLFSGASMFQIFFPAMTFIFWALLQPVYIPFIGISGLLGKYKWKS